MKDLHENRSVELDYSSADDGDDDELMVLEYDNTSGREDLSSPNSLNGYPMDGMGDPKKKKGPPPRQQEELCLVCGDRASGYHYNALTCEGCKGFFRRSITKNAVYQCKYGNGCEIDMYMRRKCQECRLKKCLQVGMRPECVVPEYQCAVKREAKRAQKEKDKPVSTTRDIISSPSDKEDSSPATKEKSVGIVSGLGGGGGGGGGINSLNILTRERTMTLTSDEEELIERLVIYQEEFESPSDEDLKKYHVNTGVVSSEALSADSESSRFELITGMTILTVQLIVEFSKHLPGFDTLSREDQITLLKACSSEVMMLRSSRKYDINTDTIVFANDRPYTRENYYTAGVGDSADPLFDFCRHMVDMKVDNAEYALLTAIVIFSERPNLQEPKKVEKIQEIYLDTLRKYAEIHRPRGHVMFARLLAVLTELRTLGCINSDMCISLKLKNKKLPPFLAEIWDIQTV